jgi:hypothetical protein
MKRKKNHEDELISRMMDHMEINKTGDDFTRKVMDRVYLETIPSRQSEKPLISNVAWIIIGIVISALLIYLFYGLTTGPGVPSGGESLFNLTLPELDYNIEFIVNWIGKYQGTLIWYCIGLVTIFGLTILERILKNLSFNRNFIL